MTLVLGIDPGASGAMAVYDTEAKRLVSVIDMPTWTMTVGKRKRNRIDSIALAEEFDTFCMMGVELLVIEAVGGRPRQSASAGFVFGYGVGLIMMASMYSKITIETVPPLKWKKMMGVPGKSAKGADDDIMGRASQLFPHDYSKFRTERGGKRVDRAEAAMLAKFGGDFVLRTMTNERSDAEFKMAYRNASAD